MKKLAVNSVLSGCFLFALMAAAQVITGTIQGTVKDQTGAVLPSAKVTIQDMDTGVSHDTVADATGHYSMPLLPVGHYQVTGSMAGFQNEVRSGIDLAVGQNAVIDLQLPVGTVTQAVEVTGEAPLVQTTDSQVSYGVNQNSIVGLPLNGRDLSQLLLLNPSVNFSPYSLTSATEAYNGFGKRYSVGGQRGEDNLFIMDGEYIADFKGHIPAGPDGALMGVETTQEFQVITSAPPAQYGGFTGGVFNAVSKSGSNQWHGDAFEFLRNSDLDARSFTDLGLTSPPPFRRNQFGGTVGGPIKKDKTFFFVGFEGLREANTITATDVVPTAAARTGVLPTGNVTVNPLIAPYLGLYPLPTPGALTFPTIGTADYIFPNNKTYTDNFGLARVDHQISDKDSLFVRYTGSNSSDFFTNFPGGALDPAGMNQTSSLGSQLAVVGETHIFSSAMVNVAHFSFSRVTPLDLGIYPTVPSTVIGNKTQSDPSELSPGSGITSEAGFDTSPTYFTSNRFHFSDDVTKTMGAHQLQFGGMAERAQLNEAFYDRYMGVWAFANITSFLQGVPNSYRGSPPPYGTYSRGLRQDLFGLYVQDAWRATPKLTINLGVRWEPYTVPTEVNNLIANLRYFNDTSGTVGSPYYQNKSMGNFEPRVGVAWSPFASGKTSVRAGFGVLYENDANQLYTQIVRQPPLSYDFTLPQTASADYFPNGNAAIAGTPTNGPGYMAPFTNFYSTEVLQYNVTVQQQLGASNLFSIGYVGTRGNHGLSVGNINVPNPVWDGTSLAVPVGATTQNAAWSQIVDYATNSSSWYNALDLSFQRRFSHGFQAQVSYTWSKNETESDSGQTAGGVTTGGGYVKIPNNMAADYGLAGYNIGQALIVNYSWDIPGPKTKGFLGGLLSGWQLSGLITVQSGPALSVLSAVPSALTTYTEENTSPNAVAPCNNLVLGGATQYFNPKCFSVPGTRELGNVGRDTLTGPGLVDWDPGLFKNQPIGERFHLQIRAEAFNILNRGDYGAPATSLYTATGGPVSGVGQITTYVLPGRQIQFSLKLIF